MPSSPAVPLAATRAGKHVGASLHLPKAHVKQLLFSVFVTLVATRPAMA